MGGCSSWRTGLNRNPTTTQGPSPAALEGLVPGAHLPPWWAIPFTQLIVTAGHLQGAGRGAKKVQGVYPRQEGGVWRAHARWMLRQGHRDERRRELHPEAENSVIHQASQRRLCSKTLIDLSLPQ